jgi:hypothetical protein
MTGVPLSDGALVLLPAASSPCGLEAVDYIATKELSVIR